MRIFLRIIFLISISFVFMSQNDCGENRAKIKTCSDLDAYKIDTVSKNATIKKLTAITPPNKIGNNMARTGIEFKTYKIKAKITYWKIEDDGDYHIVLQDLLDTTLTMVVEIPDPNCESVKNGRFYNKICAARKMFDSMKMPKNRVRYGTYKVSGVAFFDKVHGQKGVAINGVELHPVLEISR